MTSMRRAWLPWVVAAAGRADQVPGRARSRRKAAASSEAPSARSAASGGRRAARYAPPAMRHAAGDVEESMAERLGFPAARLALQAEAPEEGEQVMGGEHDLKPDLVGANWRKGNLRRPVSLPQRMRSSTRA
jgi:hypothetical protein